MKKYVLSLTGFLLLVASVLAVAQTNATEEDPEDGFVKISFIGEKFYLKGSDGNAQGISMEYFPAGQTPDSYTEKVVIQLYDGKPYTTRQVAGLVLDSLTKNYPKSSCNLVQGLKAGEWELSLLVKTPVMGEVNLFRVTSRKKQPVVFQYVRREIFPEKEDARVDAEKQFSQLIQENWRIWMDELRSFQMPHLMRITK